MIHVSRFTNGSRFQFDIFDPPSDPSQWAFSNRIDLKREGGAMGLGLVWVLGHHQLNTSFIHIFVILSV